jgi:tetraacyldisaccharide 4'-kinase
VLDPYQFRELVSGRRRGLVATLGRTLLGGLEIPYAAAVRWRNRRYDRGKSEILPAAVPVVSVGNITLGGTGKTPTVEWLARWLLARGVRVALVSRGYGAENGKPNDEALELAERLPEVPHVQNRDRVAGARRAVGEFGAQLILLDDGFQHRRLARDFDLVLIDALEPFGFDHVFPRGTLREPLSGWARADAFLLNRSELVAASRREAIRAQALRFAPRALWLEATHAPRELRSASGSVQPLTALAGRNIAAFCGIGNPDGFRHALEAAGFTIAQWRTLPDHFAYPESEIAALGRWSDASSAEAVVCTHKDLVKIGPAWPGSKPLWALSSQLEIHRGQADLEARLQPLVDRALHSCATGF